MLTVQVRNENSPLNLLMWISLVSVIGGVLVDLEGGVGENVTWVNPSKNGKRSSKLHLDRRWNNYNREVNTPLTYLYLNVNWETDSKIIKTEDATAIVTVVKIYLNN